MRPKTVSAIYCDDIRQEVGQKLSFMGVYNADMVFPSFPAQLPKFCAHVTVRFPPDEKPKNSLIVRLLSEDVVLAEANLDRTTIASFQEPVADPEVALEDMQLGFQIGLMIAPLPIPAPTKLKLRAYVDGEELKGNALKIRLANEDERIINGFPPAPSENTR